MDGIHDLGGREGFGPVDVETDEPVFHFEWERKAMAITMASFLTGLSNGGQFRHSIERMDPAHYLTSRYYEHWITGVATRLVETGRATHSDLESRAGGPFPLSRPVHPDAAGDASRARGGPTETDGGAPTETDGPAPTGADEPGPTGADEPGLTRADGPARFPVGSQVRVRNRHPRGHTRCPDYVRGKVGVVVRLDGSWSVPDLEAHLESGRREPTYSVRFEADELWGGDDGGVSVHVDLWESYLEEP